MKNTEKYNNKESLSYNFEDVMKVTKDIFSLNKENNYNAGAFVHGLIFALETAQETYKIPHNQLAEIKRGCRRYIRELSDIEEKKQ
jgi:hypothetical protein